MNNWSRIPREKGRFEGKGNELWEEVKEIRPTPFWNLRRESKEQRLSVNPYNVIEAILFNKSQF